jgi:hypothetical protein
LGGGKVVNFGFPFETITNAAVRDAYMSDVLRFFGVLRAPMLLLPQINAAAGTATLTWSASAGLKYRLQYKDNLTDAAWQTLNGDVIATNITAVKTDPGFAGVAKRFYRVLLLD